VLTTLEEETGLVLALRAGDEAAFMTLVERYQGAMVRLARVYVNDRAVAEDATQDAWLGVLRGVQRFEGRSSFRTWHFTILVNTAKARARRESRSRPFSEFGGDELGQPGEPAVDAERFRPLDDPRWPGHWASGMGPRPWELGDDPEARLLAKETQLQESRAIDALPAMQGQVVLLRDVEGLSADEVCNTLGLSESNQRVLLHRGRSKVRQALELFLSPP
jgi:RNA polymerase sigma-70 factor (ECF subfamily)